jgi:hypothetical protein
MWGALFDKRTGLSFTFAAGHRQHSHSRVRVPWDSRPYFTVSYSRLLFSSPPTTRGDTVEVFDHACIRDLPLPPRDHAARKTQLFYCCRSVLPRICLANSYCADYIENLSFLSHNVIAACLLFCTRQRTLFYCWERNFRNVFTEPLSCNGYMFHNIYGVYSENWSVSDRRMKVNMLYIRTVFRSDQVSKMSQKLKLEQSQNDGASQGSRTHVSSNHSTNDRDVI